ncbi:hypothetical protein GCM10007862_31570 [Dyella lipolytica]|nr:hypothetical protein GCM10007862_31570 [Dyella lipolytica]
MAGGLGAEDLAAVMQFVTCAVLGHDACESPPFTWQYLAAPTDMTQLFDGLGIAHEPDYACPRPYPSSALIPPDIASHETHRRC